MIDRSRRNGEGLESPHILKEIEQSVLKVIGLQDEQAANAPDPKKVDPEVKKSKTKKKEETKEPASDKKA